jgi:hypothetical protein
LEEIEDELNQIDTFLGGDFHNTTYSGFNNIDPPTITPQPLPAHDSLYVANA